jgi:hypothetical protein
MRKSLALASALVALTIFIDPGAAQQKDKEKSPLAGVDTKSTTVKGSKSNSDNRAAVSPELMTGEVTQVNEKAQAFTIGANGRQFTFSAKKLNALPEVGETIGITYTQTPGGPREATTVKSSKVTQGDDTSGRIFCGDNTDTPRCCRRNGGYWVNLGDGGGCNFYGYNYRVMQVNVKDKSLTVMAKGKAVTFSAAKLRAPLPKVGEIIDITYTQIPGGPMEASNLNLSKSNIN